MSCVLLYGDMLCYETVVDVDCGYVFKRCGVGLWMFFCAHVLYLKLCLFTYEFEYVCSLCVSDIFYF